MRSLQCARAGAALLVVYFHAALAAGHLMAAGAGGPIVLGKAGVDVFFVLSGYIIWTSTLRTPTTARAFLRKRFLRIAPLYWLLTTLAAAVALAAPSLLNSTRFQLAHYLASLFFVPWPNPASSGVTGDLMTPVIVPGWTLNFEMAFYLLFSVALFWEARFRPAVVAAVFAAAILASAALRGWSPVVDFYDPLLFLEFLSGVALGAAGARGIRLPLAPAVAALAVGGVALVGLDGIDLPVHRIVSSGLPSLLVIAAAISIESAGRWPPMPGLVALGDASFSLYLTHVFVLAGLRIVFQHTFGTLGGTPAACCYVLATLVLSCGVALACHRAVEVPLGRALSRATRTRPSRGPSPAATAAGF